MDQTADQLIARLRAQPDDAAAFSALRAHYQQIGDFASLANLIEGWATRHTDAAAAAAALTEAADLVHRYLGDRGRAANLYEQALGRRPMHDEAATRLEALLEEANDPNRLAAMLERRGLALAQSGADARTLARVHLKAGQVWQQSLGRPDKAVGYYRKAFEADPALVPAIYGAREVYRAAGNLKAAASLYEMEARAEPDQTRRVALLRELAQLRADSLEDLDGALAALDAAIAQAPGDLAVLHEMATLLLRRADAAPDPRAAQGDRDKAADALYQMAQMVPAEHAIAYCEAGLDAAPGHEGALELLERLAESESRPELLPPRWVGYLSIAGDAPGANERRAKLGHAYRRAGQAHDAIVCFEPLLEGGDLGAAEALLELYREVGRDADVPKALGVLAAALPAEERLPRLREMVDALVASGDLGEAARQARQILALAPSDTSSVKLVEASLQEAQDLTGLRDLWLNAARDPDADPDDRKGWLARAAELCEGPLGDAQTALGCWRAAAQAAPADRELRAKYAAALERHGAWDELVAVLEAEALSTADPAASVAIQRRLAAVHRDHRGDLPSAVRALSAARELDDRDPEVLAELCDGLLALDEIAAAVPLLRERIDLAPSREERGPLLRILAQRLEDSLGDDQGAYEASTRLLDDEPGDLETLDRMERIDVRNGEWDRLLTTLAYRADVTPEPQRAAVLARMGEIANHELEDLDRAAEYFANALDLTPDDGVILDHLCDVYERSGRYKELVTLLRSRADAETDETLKAELYRRIARTLDEVSSDSAAEAWERVLEAGEDEEALRALEAHASRGGEDARQSELLGRLSAIVADPSERRSLMMQRAGILAELLDDRPGAMRVLRELLDGVDPQHVPAMHELARLAAEEGDLAGVAEALERELAVTEDAGLALPLARRLADLYEGELPDAERAAAALATWSELEPESLECLGRRRACLEGLERWPELRQCLDALAHVSTDPSESARFVREAAELSARKMGDFEGAWGRLAEVVEAGDADAETLLRVLAEEAGQGERMADLYVRMARAAAHPLDQKRRWRDASDIYTELLEDTHRGLEAMLRAFAVDLGDLDTLGAVEALAERERAWARLAQVYDKLIKSAPTPEAKAELLMRHATLLDERAGETSEALDRVLRAAALVPNDDDALARAEELAVRADRGDELLYVYDRRKQAADTFDARLDAIRRAIRLLDDKLGERERAMGYLAQAVALATQSESLFDDVEAIAREMDEAHPELGDHAALTGLVGLYRRLADSATESPAHGAALLARAARLLEGELDQVSQAYSCLKRATLLVADDDHTLDELTRVAEETARLPELDTHLAHLIDEALDSKTASALLVRRGNLLADRLEKMDEAAEVYRQLRLVDKDNAEAGPRLRACLRKAGKHQDLLLVLDQELARTRDLDARLELEREVARVWDHELDNRWEAIDAWQRVQQLAPDDAEAREALERRGQQATRRLSTEELGVLDEVVELSDERPLPDLTDEEGPTTDELDASPSEGATAGGEVEDEDGLDVHPAAEAEAPEESTPPEDDAAVVGHAGEAEAADGSAASEAAPGVPPESAADAGTAGEHGVTSAAAPPPATDFDEETETGDAEDFGLPLPSGAPPAPSAETLGTGEIEALTTGELSAVSPEEIAALSDDEGQVLESFASMDEDVLEVSGLVELPEDGADDLPEEMALDELDAVEMLEDDAPDSTPPAPPRRTSVPPPPPAASAGRGASVPPPPPGARSVPPPPPPGTRSVPPPPPGAPSVPPPPPRRDD